jgi:hypothetical protein
VIDGRLDLVEAAFDVHFEADILLFDLDYCGYGIL